MLGDNCLREIDPYLNAFNKTVLRPSASKRYIVYILRLHYKRWMTDLNPPPKKPK